MSTEWGCRETYGDAGRLGEGNWGFRETARGEGGKANRMRGFTTVGGYNGDY